MNQWDRYLIVSLRIMETSKIQQEIQINAYVQGFIKTTPPIYQNSRSQRNVRTHDLLYRNEE